MFPRLITLCKSVSAIHENNINGNSEFQTELNFVLFTMRRYASAVNAVIMCLCVRHMPELYQNS